MLEVVILKKYFRLLVITNFLFLFCSLPKLTIYAAQIDLKKCALPHGGTFTVSDLYSGQEYAFGVPSSEGNVYLLTTENGDNDEMYFISDSKFSGGLAYECNGKTFYMTEFNINSYPGVFVHPKEISVPYIHCPWSGTRSFYGQIFYGDSSEFEFNQKEGSLDLPIYDENIGYPNIQKETYTFSSPSSGGENDKLTSADYFTWKRKSTTGFDILDNDYRLVYIQTKLKSQFQYNDNLIGSGSWHNYDNYGEEGDIELNRADLLKLSVNLDEKVSALPNTYKEGHNFKAHKEEIVFYFRLVCMNTDSLQVIPDESSCVYTAGPWRSITVSSINGKNKTALIEDGNFNEKGDWIPDSDSSDNGKDIHNGEVGGADLDDAQDQVDSGAGTQNKSDLSVDSAKNSIKDMLEMVGFIPTMIGTLFSFLPGWCLNLLASFFVALCVLIVYKLIRG